MASGHMPASIGRTYDCTAPTGSDLHKHLACRAVPQLFCVLIYTVPRDVFGTEATGVELQRPATIPIASWSVETFYCDKSHW